MKRISICIAALSFCVISIQVTAQVTGSGTTNYLPIWTGSAKLANSKIFQTGGKVGLGTTTPAATLDVVGPSATTGGTSAVTVFALWEEEAAAIRRKRLAQLVQGAAYSSALEISGDSPEKQTEVVRK